eukprot:sb/3474801/
MGLYLHCQSSTSFTATLGHSCALTKPPANPQPGKPLMVNREPITKAPERTSRSLYHMSLSPGYSPCEDVSIDPVQQRIIFLDSLLGRITFTNLKGELKKYVYHKRFKGAREFTVDFVSDLMFWIYGDTLQIIN